MGWKWVERCVALATLLSPNLAYANLEIAPGPTGGFGVLLVAGPLATAPAGRRATLKADFPLPEGVDQKGSGIQWGGVVDKRPGDQGTWKILADASALLDLKSHFKSKSSEATALAFGVLRVTQPLRGYLSLGVDDGVVVYLDGKQILARDDARATYPEDDLLPLELAPGDHPLLFKLHQRGGAWTLRLRVTDEALGAARGVSWVLPGEIERSQVEKDLLSIQLERRPVPSGLEPRLKVQLSGGWPRSAERNIQVSAQIAGAAPLYTVRAGSFPLEEQGPAQPMTVRLPKLEATELDGDPEVQFEVRVGSVRRTFTATPRVALRSVIARAAVARKIASEKPDFLKDPEATIATIDALVQRGEDFASHGDRDLSAQLEEASALGLFLDAIERKEDPFGAIRGARRIAYRSPLDGKPSTMALYVPPRFDPSKKYPLVVALHGMNGKPMTMLRWIFGRDDPNQGGEWEDRHPGTFPDYDALVVAPMAHYNSFYRYAGEEDVVAAMEWVRRMFPVDSRRISISGPSMGGTGTAWVAFRYAERFSAAAPLCGYHSYFIRGDMAGKKLRPWERLQAEERSTIYWAANGLHLPLYIVHGKRDLPEENSGVLIDRYKNLGYSLLEEHPDEGHNVWQPTYEGLKGLRWLTSFARPQDPSRVVLRSNNLRYDRSDWVHLLRLQRSLAWGEISATRKRTKGSLHVDVKTSGVAAFELTLERQADASAQVKIDKDTLEIPQGQPLRFEQQEGKWQLGVHESKGLRKQARLAGPLRDVHHEPTILVYGTSDKKLARANEEVARWWGAIRGGFEIDYPIVADVDFDPSMAKGKALVLVGGSQSNVVTRRLEGRLPIHVTTQPPEVRVGSKKYEGSGLGATFVYPNPEQPAQYVVVIAGTDVSGTLRAMSMPDMLPDYLVYDRRLAPARGQLTLGRAEIVDGGQFDERWQLSSEP